MRPTRLARTALLACSSLVIVACGDDTETGTASGGGSAASTSSDATTATGSGSTSTASSSSGDGGDTGSGGDGGDGGGGELEVIEGPGFRSGSRLRPVYLDGGDGAKQLLYWYDREIQLPCRFMETTAAGETYACLPLGHGGARIRFTDAACTEPVLIESEGECDDRFASTSTDYEVVSATATSQFARGTRTTYERGDLVDPQPEVFEKGFEGFAATCAPASLQDGDVVHVAVAPPVPLVTATRELESLGEGLARAVAHGDDGSTQVMGPFDEETATPCQYLLNTTVDGGLACAPAVIAEFASPTTYFGNIHYADDACAIPAASVLIADLPSTLPDFVVGPSEVRGELVAYERGERLDVAYGGFSGACAEHGNTVDHFAVGAPLDRTFPHVLDLDVPGGRLVSTAYGSASGEIASSPYGFSDTAFVDRWCKPLVLAAENYDGAAPLRCVPGTRLPAEGSPFPTEGNYFADPGCTDPLVEFGGGVAYRMNEVAEAACSALPARDEVMEAVLFTSYDDTVYERWGDSCEAYGGNGYPEYFSRRVRDLAPEDFAIVTLVDPSIDAP